MLHPRRLPVLLLLALLTLLLAACGDRADSGPTDTINAVVEHLREGDMAAASVLTTDPALLTEAELTDFDVELLQAVTNHLSIEVLEQEIDGNQATVRVRGTNVSMPSVFQEFMTFGNMLMYGMMGEEGETMMTAALVEQLRSNDAPTRTDEVDAHLHNVGGEWLLYVPGTFNEDAPPFWNVLFGYVNDITL